MRTAFLKFIPRQARCLLMFLFIAGAASLFADDQFIAWGGEGTSKTVSAVGGLAAETSDEFVSWNEEFRACDTAAADSELSMTDLFWKFGSVGLTVLLTLIGTIAVHRTALLKVRPLILLLSVTVIGFILGACPCLIKGVQSPFAALRGTSAMHWIPAGGVLIILALTYLFGPSFCGWACPLGALQEFLFLNKNGSNPSERTRTVMLWIRRISFLLLIIWLSTTGILFWEEYDPFKAIFNLQVFSWISGVLITVLLIFSIYVFRPFCRTLCPLGLLSGLTARLPGAPGPTVQESCTNCMLCAKTCKMGALNNPKQINKEFCIGCGDCLTVCRRESIRWTRQINRNETS
jgi:polyferredoxin